MSFEIDIHNRQTEIPLDLDDLRDALIHGLTVERVQSAVISVTIVDNASIHILNRDHLQHDYPTDVISFPLEHTGDPDQIHAAINRGDSGLFPAEKAHIEGEIVASAEMAASISPEVGVSADAELKLYVIHGMLHLCGYDDRTPEQKAVMRTRESEILDPGDPSTTRSSKP